MPDFVKKELMEACAGSPAQFTDSVSSAYDAVFESEEEPLDESLFGCAVSGAGAYMGYRGAKWAANKLFGDGKEDAESDDKEDKKLPEAVDSLEECGGETLEEGILGNAAKHAAATAGAYMGYRAAKWGVNKLFGKDKKKKSDSRSKGPDCNLGSDKGSPDSDLGGKKLDEAVTTTAPANSPAAQSATQPANQQNNGDVIPVNTENILSSKNAAAIPALLKNAQQTQQQADKAQKALDDALVAGSNDQNTQGTQGTSQNAQA